MFLNRIVLRCFCGCVQRGPLFKIKIVKQRYDKVDKKRNFMIFPIKIYL